MYSSIIQNIIAIVILGTCWITTSCNQPVRDQVINHDYADLLIDTIQLKIEKKINESSGLIKLNNTLWTHNDSGGEPILYEIDPVSGKETRSVHINNTKNTDWEEITRDSSYVYIGNYGNNLGKRKNLEIYKIQTASLLSQESVNPEIIKFNYPEQEIFPGSYDHNFDCEAMITLGDSLYLFTKNWQDGQCSIYALPKNEGSYAGRLISTFDTKGTITGASHNPLTNEIILLGYNLDGPRGGFHPFIWILSDYNSTDFFSGKQVRYNLNLVRQAEAIVWDKGDRYYFSAENENGGYASLFSLTIPR